MSQLEATGAATSAQLYWKEWTWWRRDAHGSTWGRAWGDPGHTLTMNQEGTIFHWTGQVCSFTPLMYFDLSVDTKFFTVTAMPGESYHAPHPPLRQRLSVGGGPAQVCTLPFIIIHHFLELSFHKTTIHLTNVLGTIWDWWDCCEWRGETWGALQDCHYYRVGRHFNWDCFSVAV